MLGALASAVGVAAAASAGYQSMSPTGQWFGKTFTGLPAGTRQLALTYDDGPNDPYTLRLLEVLARRDVRATFFLIGRYVRQRPGIVQELVKAGHAIGNHTFTHPLLIFKTKAQIRREIVDCESALTEIRPVPQLPLFRPPFGGRRPEVLRVAREVGLQPVMWTIAGYDWKAPSAEYIEEKLVRNVRGGEVVLLHDGGHKNFGADRSRTVEATANSIKRYQSEGYKFVTIPEMITQQQVSSH
ncbi:MAG: polysaccharide deacetylase family protein [Acidobacteriales bacterium]|nr:polysaccharide deacetylase family protein [Terriglobales bacterium]